MAYEWFDDYLLKKTGVAKDFKPEWSAERFMVRDKMFVMKGGDKYGKPIITFKLAPATNYMLREKYPEIIVPGYYCNKDHWSSLYMDGNVPDDLVRCMADEAYSVLVSSFSKKVQAEILVGQ